MAGGKLSPRQKMINLMYLVFIAMMAMQISVEVITAFGLMNKKFESANIAADSNNEVLLSGLATRAQDDPTRYTQPYETAKQVRNLSNEFFNYIGGLKDDATEGFEIDPETGEYPYELMGKGAGIDYGWFEKDGYSEKGKEIVARFQKYREDFRSIIGEGTENDTKYGFLFDKLDEKFSTEDVLNKDGQPRPYLEYHFKGFPAVASLAYLSSLQNDVRELENGAYNLLLGNSLEQAASMRNYQAMVITDKSVYYQGETINYKVVLGRYDESTVPTEVVVNGVKIPQERIKDGQVASSMTAGALGDHKFTGKFTFMEDGEAIPVDILNSNYIVVSRPTMVTISADKMNVVYIGLDNPISVTVEGVTADKVNASVSGTATLTKVSNGKYMLKPGTGSREVVVSATGTMSDGQTISSDHTFRVKMIPRPLGTIRGETDARGPASNLANVTVGARLEDFDFDLNLRVTQFTIVFPGTGSEVINGTRLTQAAQDKAARLRPGDVVRIVNIKTSLEGAPDVILRDPTNATFTIQ
ncbi:MAG TPA: gliding motility protein GldM [Flavobacterium sp.]|nr:gliding motility protein GldM [Flavobacterium sp.]